jgi:hypothetical protein
MKGFKQIDFLLFILYTFRHYFYEMCMKVIELLDIAYCIKSLLMIPH